MSNQTYLYVLFASIDYREKRTRKLYNEQLNPEMDASENNIENNFFVDQYNPYLF